MLMICDRLIKTTRGLVLIVGLCAFGAVADAAGQALGWQQLYEAGIAYRQQGQLQQAVDVLRRAHFSAGEADQRHRVQGELGIALLQAGRLDQAEVWLLKAHEQAADARDQVRWGLSLGHLYRRQQIYPQARQYYQQALAVAGQNAALLVLQQQAALALMQWRPQQPVARSDVQTHYQQLQQLPVDHAVVALLLNLSSLAVQAGDTVLAYQILQQVQQETEQLAPSVQTTRLQAEAVSATARLYEQQQRYTEALTLNQQADRLLAALPQSLAADLQLQMDWRRARLNRQLGLDRVALAAYRQAVTQLQAIRLDMPFSNAQGQSTFQTVVRPLYLQFIDLLLDQAGQQDEAQRQALLYQARNQVEQLRRSVMQDYFGDNCTIEITRGWGDSAVPDDTAVIYPVIFEDRLELLVQTAAGMSRYQASVPQRVLDRVARQFARSLRTGSDGYLRLSQQLYRWILAPVASDMKQAQLQTLVMVPGGSLRMVPMQALHDGQQYAVEQFAVTMATGLSMTNVSEPVRSGRDALLAGVATPGPVLDYLSEDLVNQMLASVSADGQVPGLAAQTVTRALATPWSTHQLSAMERSQLQQVLSLPAVTEEIMTIDRLVDSHYLLDESFTVRQFQSQAAQGDYQTIHIASHGVFAGQADNSFILTYDNLMTLDDLQFLLRADQLRRNPLELLVLSACETAEGNDRAPLGIAGAAIKARAKSVLGTLWPVEDRAAQQLMAGFYQAHQQDQTKAQALRQAQLQLLKDEQFAHPFFWAPFVLIGNWL